MANKVYWLSRHQLSPAQQQALKDIWGEDVEVVHEDVTFDENYSLNQAIADRKDGFVYAVAPVISLIYAYAWYNDFGIFENDPKKRADGAFGLKAVWHFRANEDYHPEPPAINRVWENPDPSSDEGEALTPGGSR